MRPPGAVAVVVLGDLGRSPRMQYHTLSLVEQAGKEVHVIAYGGTQPHASLLHNKLVHIHTLPDVATFLKSWLPFRALPRPTMMVAKALLQVVALFYTLLIAVPRTEFVLLQTPPCIPTFAVCKVACLAKRSKLVIDWHNFGYTLLALNLRPGHLFVRIAEWYERALGKVGDYHFCVTKAMKRELESHWGVPKASVLYDRPPQFFQPLSRLDTHNLFVKLAEELSAPMHVRDCCSLSSAATTRSSSGKTLFTEKVTASPSGGGTTIAKLATRPALIVSSTSWTPDEDFGILLKAAEIYDEMTHDLKSYPRLLFVITGKGPMKEMYRNRMSKMTFRKVAFRTLWLSAEDYPRMVSAADLGVSLHVSSSGFDLPMKVVDMFGCGVPVCSANYTCVEELVHNDRNGMLFNDAQELAEQLKALFHNFPEENSRLVKLRAGASASSKRRWTDEWAKVAMGVFAKNKKD